MNETSNDSEDTFSRDQERIREEAYSLWLAEGQPEGRADAHWAAAKEIVATRDGLESTLIPVEETTGETVEPAFVADVHGDVPGRTDQVDSEQAPSRARAAAGAAAQPTRTKPARKTKSKA